MTHVFTLYLLFKVESCRKGSFSRKGIVFTFFKLKHSNYKLVHIIKPKNGARSVSLNVSPIHEVKS